MLSINARDFNNTAFQVREPGVLALIAVSGVLWQPAQREITFQYSLQGRFNSSQLQGWRLPLPCKGRAVGRGLVFCMSWNVACGRLRSQGDGKNDSALQQDLASLRFRQME